MSPQRFITKVNFYLTHAEEDLPKLSDMERQIIEMRLGLGEYTRQHTLLEISQYLDNNNTHGWARGKIKKILKKVRYEMKPNND